MKKTINIRGLQNAETYINRVLANLKAKNRNLLSVTTDGDSITFSFKNSHLNKITRRIVAKQFSKKKYASISEARAKFHYWRELLVVEQSKYWLFIYIE